MSKKKKSKKEVEVLSFKIVPKGNDFYSVEDIKPKNAIVIVSRSEVGVYEINWQIFPE